MSTINSISHGLLIFSKYNDSMIDCDHDIIRVLSPSVSLLDGEKLKDLEWNYDSNAEDWYFYI